MTFLAGHPSVDPDRIAVIGSSFGGAVAVYGGGVDQRIAAVVSNGGWGHGERKFRGQHPTPEAWARFTAMLEEGRAHRARTGKSLMVSRYDIVPIPQHVRDNLARQSVEMFTANHVEMFPAETAQSMFDFRAEDVVGAHRAAPAAAHPQRLEFGHPDRAIDRDVPPRRPAERAASVQRPRPFPVRREQRPGLGRHAGLAEDYFPVT